MLRIANLEEIYSILLQIPVLINLVEQRNPSFIVEVKRWLSTLEEVLNQNHMPVTSSVAALRGVLISAERGVVPAGATLQGRATKHKMSETTAITIVQSINELVSNTIQGDQTRINEAEQIARQLIAIAYFKGVFSTQPYVDDHTENLKIIWRSMAADSDTQQGTVRLSGLVGPYDALIVIDRVIAAGISIDDIPG